MMTRLACFCCALVFLLTGCAADPAGVRQGPAAAADLRTGSWSYEGTPGRKVESAHYVVYTTIDDPEVVQSVGQVMEAALTQYRKLAPDVPPSDRPMECFLFDRRNQWAAFTERHTGPDAAVYLQINRGGYTVGDWYVSYFIGDLATYSVAAHEGWHQFVARHFKQRPPPFLEEGLACLFEDVQWDANGRLPRWDLSKNSNRLRGLRNALDDGMLLPLTQLVSMHAGQVVDQSSGRIEAFYAQNWAFARFLWDGEGGRYRPALQKLLNDAAAGRVEGRLGRALPRTDHAGGEWDAAAAGELLEHYLGEDLPKVDRQFRAYVKRIAGQGRHQPGW